MPIEFHCRQCNKLLRVADEHAGKNAQCPECQTVQPVPDRAAAGESGPAGGAGGPQPGGFGGPQPSPPPGGAPEGAAPFGAQPAGGPFNPYASPTMAGGFQAPTTAAYGERNGPPWERDGASVASLVATVKESLAQPITFFSQMRRDGGLGGPIGFAIAMSYFGFIVGMIWQLAFQALMVGVAGGAPGAEEQLAITGIAFAGGLVCIPVLAILQLFIAGGIYHLMLMMVGGANYSYEATVRTVAYTQGVVNLCLLIPFCGQYISGIVGLVYLIIGFCHVHETSGGKAVAAVLIPFAICCAALVGFFVLVFAAAQPQGF